MRDHINYSRFNLLVILLSVVVERDGMVQSIDIMMTPPDISIGGWMDNDFDSFEWHTNTTPPLGNSPFHDAIVVPNTVRALSLVCNASYPVEWRFHRERWGGHSRLQYALQTTRVSNGLDLVRFSSELSFFSFQSNGVTGNYTCQKVGNPWLSQSLFVFWEGGSPPFLTLARSFRKPPLVPFRNDSISFTLPCAVSSPSVIPRLTKENSNTNTEEPINLNSSVQYDPRIGFTLTNLPNPYGRYTCLGDDEEEGDGDLVSFNVVNADDGPKPEFNETIKHGASYYINTTTRELSCCSAGQNPPKLKLVECDHPTICALAKHTLHTMESAKKKELSCSMITLHALRAGVFRCVGTGIDVVREYFFPIPEDPKPVWGRGGKGGGKGKGQGRRRQWGGKGGNDNDTDNTTAVATPAPAPVVTEDPYYSWNEADELKMMMVTKLKGPLYIGENRTFSCRVSHFYYARGLVWGIKLANQSIAILNGRDSKRQQQQHHWGNIHHFKILIGKNQQFLDLTVTADLENITCYAPVWNSTEWGKKSINLVVEHPTAPKLKGNAHKEYSWYLNDTNKALTCQFTGEPWPTVVWKKGNATYTLNTNTTNGTSTVTFPRVTLDSDGEYTCILSNPAGTLTKTFRVTVLHSTSGAISAVLIFCVIGFVVVSAIAGIMFKYLRSQNNVINHLANLAFKDVTGNGDASNSSNTNAGSTATNRSAVSVDANGVVLPSLSSQPISISSTGATLDPFRKENGRTNHGFTFDYSNRHSDPTGEASTHEGSPPTREPPLSSFSSYHKF